MKHDDLEDLGPKLEIAEISAFEQRIGFALPADYRKFLQQTNGASVPERTGHFFIDDANWWIHVNCFFGIRGSDANSYVLEKILERLYEQYPERFAPSSGKLPIASDDFGNKIYLWLTGPERGCVYFWMHDADDQDDKLNSSFQSFLESLKGAPPELPVEHK